MDVNNVAAGIAARADTITDLQALAYAPDDGEPHLFWVSSVEPTYDLAMSNGHDEMVFTCFLIVSRVNDSTAQHAVRQYLNGSGATSIRAAIRTDKTLSGSASDARVMSARGPIPIELGSNRYIGAQFTIWVGGRGDA